MSLQPHIFGLGLTDPAWKFRYAAACLWPTLTLATADAASYEDAMALDRKIRTFPVPARLQVALQSSEVWSWSSDPSKAVQQFSVVCDRELSKFNSSHDVVCLHSRGYQRNAARQHRW